MHSVVIHISNGFTARKPIRNGLKEDLMVGGIYGSMFLRLLLNEAMFRAKIMSKTSPMTLKL